MRFLPTHPRALGSSYSRSLGSSCKIPNCPSVLADVDGYIQTYAPRYGVDINFSRAISMAESCGGRNNGPSSAGAVGPFQVLPSTARWLSSMSDDPLVQNANPYDTEGSVILGNYYLGYLQALFSDPWQVAGAYNGGEGKVQSCINQSGSNWLSCMRAETQCYVPKVQQYYANLGGSVDGGNILANVTDLSWLDKLTSPIEKWTGN